ncbi:tol-pal system-associated acyl-CoA thioesterase [Dongia deserti]|uniref:tol-pal system-associated acyl-CoA thioesterase n=1 Tax=Dongia deserti TaxID=2268030 RepID=UPI002548E46D|nr:tol-pal system-associated acyl-CoA thioesterase [Dongia deserti]
MPQAPMATHRQTIRVYFEDTDAAGIVYYANYLKFAERARTDMLRDLGISHAEMMKRDGHVLVVRRCEIDYLKPAKLDDLLTVETVAMKLGGASVELRQRVLRDGDVLAELKVLVVCIGNDGRPARIPDYVRGAIPRANQSE